MHKPLRTADELKNLICAEVTSNDAFREEQTADPGLGIEVGTPTPHAFDGVANWSIPQIPREEGYMRLIMEAIHNARVAYDLRA